MEDHNSGVLKKTIYPNPSKRPTLNLGPKGRTLYQQTTRLKRLKATLTGGFFVTPG